MLNILVFAIFSLVIGAIFIRDLSSGMTSIKGGAAMSSICLLIIFVWNQFLSPLSYGVADLILVRRFPIGSLVFYIGYLLLFGGVGGVIGSLVRPSKP